MWVIAKIDPNRRKLYFTSHGSWSTNKANAHRIHNKANFILMGSEFFERLEETDLMEADEEEACFQ